jgi:hypothetical protein
MINIHLNSEANTILINVGQIITDTNNLTLSAINPFNNVEINIPLGEDESNGAPVYNRYTLAGSLFAALTPGFTTYKVISPEHDRPIDTGYLHTITDDPDTVTFPTIDDDVIQFKPLN